MITVVCAAAIAYLVLDGRHTTTMRRSRSAFVVLLSPGQPEARAFQHTACRFSMTMPHVPYSYLTPKMCQWHVES